MKQNYKILGSFLLLIISLTSNAQQNSPWREVSHKEVSGVYVSTGCHDYSLTNGQGFSVYLKNTGIQTENISGLLVAKTVCGNNVTSRFNVTLPPGEVANGSDFFNATSTGQTSVVTAADCKGVKYTKLPYSKFINRIKTVTVTDLVVTPIGGTPTNSLTTPAVQASVPTQTVQTTTPAVTTTITQVAKTYIPASIPQNLKFDSIAYLRKNWNYIEDSLNNTISGLKLQNGSLLDSFTQYKSNYLKLSNSINTNALTTVVKPSITAPQIGDFSFDINAGIGWDKFPLAINYDSAIIKTTGLGVTSHPVIQVGCTAGFFNNSTVSLSVSPFLSYGFNIGSGEKGHHLTYGANADALIRLRNNSPLKLALELGYTGRNGSLTRNNTSADYNYGVVRYGIGLRYTASCKKCWIQPGVYFESPSASDFGTSPALVYNITTQIATNWKVSINYSKDYFTTGTVKYLSTITGTSDYFGLRILHNFKIK